MRLTGYRDSDRELLCGHWLPGELLARPLTSRPVLAEPLVVPLPAGADEELTVVRDTAFVRLSRIDWTARRARLEIGMQEAPATSAKQVLGLALSFAFDTLGLRRLHGLVTPGTEGDPEVLRSSGLVREATVPAALWHDGAPVDREIWAVLRHA